MRENDSKVSLRHFVQNSDSLKKSPNCANNFKSFRSSNCFFSTFIGLIPFIRVSIGSLQLAKPFFQKNYQFRFLRRNPSGPKLPDIFHFHSLRFSNSFFSVTAKWISSLEQQGLNQQLCSHIKLCIQKMIDFVPLRKYFAGSKKPKDCC